MSRRRGWAVVLLTLGAMLALTAPASATPVKPFSIVLCAPGEAWCAAPVSGSAIVPPNAMSQTMTATITNENKPGTGLQVGSINLTPPSDFSVNPMGTSYPSCSSCSVSVVNNGTLVELRNLNLNPGATVVLSMSVNTPASGYTVASAASSPWTIVAKQSNDFSGTPGNDVNVDPNTSSLTTVLGVLQFDNEPADVALGADITNVDYNPKASPVTVGAVDLSGNPISWFNGPVTVALNPSSGGLGGTTTVAAGPNGVASFGNLTVATDGYNYTLSASTPNLTGTTSSDFDAHDQGTSANCATGKCTGSLTQTGPVSQTTQVNSTSNAGLLTVALDNGTSYWSEPAIFADCGNYTPLGPDTAVIDLNAAATKTITDTVTETVSSGSAEKALVAAQQMCFAATSDFVSSSGDPLNGNLAYPATLPNGQAGFVGLLSDCSAVNPATTPCVSSRTGTYKSQVANIEIIVTVPASFTGDPLRSH